MTKAKRTVSPAPAGTSQKSAGREERYLGGCTAKPGAIMCMLAVMVVCGAAAGVERQFIDLGISTRSYTVDNSGNAAGWVHPSYHAYIFSNGTKVDIGTLGGSTGTAYAMNNSGGVTGWADTLGNVTRHAFLYRNGVMSDLGALGGTYSEGYGINESGQVVGKIGFAGGNTHAFLYSSGVMIDIGTLGGASSAAFGINDSGQVVGLACISGTNVNHAFLYENSTMTDIGTLGGAYSAAYSINDYRQITGESLTATGALHPFLYTGGSMVDLGLLPGWSWAEGRHVNNIGQVVGYGANPGSRWGYSGFLYSDGVMVDLNTFLTPEYSGWYIYDAMSISDNGQISGTVVGPDGKYHGYILTPEPGTMMLVGIGGILLRRRR